MWLAGCFCVGGGQVHWALDAILGHKHNQPVCPDLHTNGWALSGLGSELPAGPSSASFTVQEPPFNGVRVRHRYTNWFAEPAKSLRCPQQIICGASATVVRPFAAPQRPLQLRDH